ncbi:nucleophile aminohydrolase [Coprinopsis sp. MPI-PUGE-AT-0042]|nr:nucleophile aminohydrolase [Coprinopsis sp. MPI-PUGE-AT-0042]
MFADGVQRTQQPIVTGTSVLAPRYKDGIMMAADNLACYGSLARFKDLQCLQPAGTNTVVDTGSDMSDFQYIQRVLDDLVIDEFTAHDGHSLVPRDIHEHLSQINPLWNSLLAGGFKNGESFLAYVDLLRTTYSASTFATGYGAYLAQPLPRSEVEGKEETLTEEEALAIMEKCMRYQIATVTEKGVNISESKYLTTSWSFTEGILRRNDPFIPTKSAGYRGPLERRM